MADQFSFGPGWLQNIYNGIAPTLPDTSRWSILPAVSTNTGSSLIGSQAPSASNPGNDPSYYAPGWPTISLTPWQPQVSAPAAANASGDASPVIDSNNAAVKSDAPNPFGFASDMLDGQLAGTYGVLKAFGAPNALNAIRGIDDYTGPMGNALLAAEKGLDAYRGMQNDPSAGDALLGAAVNGLLTYGARAVTTAVTKKPMYGVLAGQAVGRFLPDDVKVGRAIDRILPPELLYQSALYGGGD